MYGSYGSSTATRVPSALSIWLILRMSRANMLFSTNVAFAPNVPASLR